MTFSFSFGLADVFNPDEPLGWDEKEALLAIRDREVEDYLSGAGQGSVGGWQSYVPTWTTTGSAATIGNGTLRGYYARTGNIVHYNIATVFGSSTNGGTGFYTWSLPIRAATRAGFEWWGTCKAYSNTGNVNFVGGAYVGSGNQVVQGFLPQSATNASCSTSGIRNSATGATGEGIPTIAGAYTWTSGGNIILTGFYEAAS